MILLELIDAREPGFVERAEIECPLTNLAIRKAIREEFGLKGADLELEFDTGNFKRWEVVGTEVRVMVTVL